MGIVRISTGTLARTKPLVGSDLRTWHRLCSEAKNPLPVDESLGSHSQALRGYRNKRRIHRMSEVSPRQSVFRISPVRVTRIGEGHAHGCGCVVHEVTNLD
jgi:hypothetical protein